MPFISKAGLTALDNYKYQSGGYSTFDNVMNPFWEFCVKLLPQTMAPNMVTMIGTMALMFMFGLSAYVSPDMGADVPGWVCVLSGACLFFYNTMDSIDGKQARRTKTSSPLGQLFDHGCDALGLLLITSTLVTCLQLGASPIMAVFMGMGQITFFLAQWEEYHVHSIRTHIGFVGVTETAYSTIGLMVLCGVLPHSFWTTPLFDLHPFLAPRYIVFGVLATLAMFSIVSLLGNTLRKAENKVTAVVHLIPTTVIVASLGFLALWEGADGATVLARHPRLVVTSLGLLHIHYITTIIVCTLTKMAYPWAQPILLAVVAMVANCVFTFVPLSVGLWAFLAAVVAVYLNFVTAAINEICIHRNIYCFKLGPRVKGE